jgi:hypothetical protein
MKPEHFEIIKKELKSRWLITKELYALLHSVRRLKVPLQKEFIRKGDDKDGGYVVINDLSNRDTLFSIGVGDNISFDLDCENQVSKIVLIDECAISQ